MPNIQYPIDFYFNSLYSKSKSKEFQHDSRGIVILKLNREWFINRWLIFANSSLHLCPCQHFIVHFNMSGTNYQH